MFQWLFGERRKERQAIVDALYESIVANARRPRFYEDWDVPDTPLGRFEMLSVHFFLLLHRVRDKDGGLREIAQELTDHFFLDLDHSLREFGIGDMGVPKRMKKFAKMFYGRLASYTEAVDSGDVVALTGALRRNVRPDDGTWNGAEPIAEYIIRANIGLNDITDEELLAGKLRFVPLEQETIR
jgi:cytochrome b pre-mRNA-processing protein 3